jgi:hypothetical protein
MKRLSKDDLAVFPKYPIFAGGKTNLTSIIALVR